MIRRYIERFVPAPVANFWCHVTEGAFASFGEELVSVHVVFPVLAGALGAGPSLLGILTSVCGCAFIAPLLLAPRVERTAKKKRLVLILGIGQRLPLLFTALVLVLVGRRSPLTCLCLIVFFRFARQVSVSTLMPPWMALIAETIPEHRVGRLFGFRYGISSALGLMAGAACAGILAALAFPANYATLYAAAFCIMLVSWLTFAFVDEMPLCETPAESTPPRHYFRDLLAALGRDANYRRYLSFQALSRVAATAAAPFYAFAAVRYHGISEAMAAGAFIAASNAARIAGNFTFPFLADRVGHRHLLALSAICQAAAALTAALARSGAWFGLVFFLTGLGAACHSVSGAAFLILVSPRAKRVGYVTLSMALLAPLGMVMAPIAGIAMQSLGPAMVFSVASGLMLAALIPLARCTPH